MWHLAWPLALAELGWMAQGVVDLIMAGPLGPAAMGAGSLGNMLFYSVAVFGSGVLLGMDTLVAHAFGAADLRDCRKTLVNGVWIAVGFTVPLMALVRLLIPIMRMAGTNRQVLEQFDPYLKALTWSLLPLLLYSAFRRYLQSMNVVKPVTVSLIVANLVNLLGNWVLMYGHWGAPALGLAGSGWSTAIARLFMAAFLGAVIWWRHRGTGGVLADASPWPDFQRARRLTSLGLPAATQIAVEIALFAVVTALVARLDEVSLAAHSIAVSVISTTFMVPLGVSSAAAVRVGQAFGRKDIYGVALAGWTAVLLSAVFMGSAGLALGFLPRWIVRIYTADPAVITSGAVLLQIAALFQLFDGFQVVTTGALRGLGDTRTAMVAHLVGYWLIGLPAGYMLCFHSGWGVRGIWTGLSTALILIGVALILAWRARVRQLDFEQPLPAVLS